MHENLFVERNFLACALVICGCDTKQKQAASALTHGGNPDAGRREIEYYGCTSCRALPVLKD